MLRAVVERVEAPQEWNFMGPTVTPVEAQIGNHERRQAAQPQRPGGNRGVHAHRNIAVSDIGGDGQRNHKQQVGHHAADEIEPEIAEGRLGKYFLSMHRDKLFQWHKNEG